MSWTRDQQWDVFARAGMLALCDVTIGAVVHAGVYVGIAQPDRLFIDGSSQQTDYEMEFETGSLPGLAVGDTIANTKDGTQYAVRSMPRFSSSTGWYSKCNLAMVDRAMPKAPLALVAGESAPVNPPIAVGNTTDEFISKIAARALGGNRVVVWVGAGQCDYADNAVLAHADRILGLTVGAAALGAAVAVQNEGEMAFSGWSWVPEQPVFLGASGMLTQVVPASPAVFLQEIGYAMTATQIFIDIKPPILLE